jgi:hypothetical protein
VSLIDEFDYIENMKLKKNKIDGEVYIDIYSRSRREISK